MMRIIITITRIIVRSVYRREEKRIRMRCRELDVIERKDTP